MKEIELMIAGLSVNLLARIHDNQRKIESLKPDTHSTEAVDVLAEGSVIYGQTSMLYTVSRELLGEEHNNTKKVEDLLNLFKGEQNATHDN